MAITGSANGRLLISVVDEKGGRIRERIPKVM